MRGRARENEFVIKLANLNFVSTPLICFAVHLMESREDVEDRRRKQVRLIRKKKQDAEGGFGAKDAGGAR